MNSQNFVFPPPPPPPPQVGPQSYPSYAPPPYQQNFSQHGGGYGARGRGGNFRGSRGGSSYNGQTLRSNGYVAANNGYNSQTNGYPNGAYPLPNYPTIQQNQYPVQGGYGYGTSPMHGSGPLTSGPRTGTYNPSNFPNKQVPFESRHSNQQQYQSQAVPPMVMGPPIRMGFDAEQPNRFQQTPIPQPNPYSHTDSNRMVPFPSSENNVNGHRRQNSPGDIRPTRNYSPSPFPSYRGRGQKRMHSDAFGSSRTSVLRTPAAPAVPSFGNALPVKPPLPQENGKKPRKKKRKHNQLGLTPRTEEHESSEEELDVDEEKKLAVQAGIKGPKDELQFIYKGRTATLKSAADIAAWIEERKKRFPTKARADETAKHKQKMMEEAKAAKLQRKDDNKKKQREADHKCQDLDKEAKVKMKAEKLRKQYEKAQRRVAELEARKPNLGDIAAFEYEEVPSPKRNLTQMNTASHPQTKEEEYKVVGEKHGDGPSVEAGWLKSIASLEMIPVAISAKIKAEDDITVIRKVISNSNEKASENVAITADPLTPTSQPISPDIPISSSLQDLGTSPPPRLPANGALDSSSIDLDISSSDDGSSSDLSTSSSDLSDSDAESAPVEAASNHQPTSNIPLHKTINKKSKAICKRFLANGRCPMGDKCRYRHELPERGTRKQNTEKRGNEEVKKERMSLYQRMVKQEQDAEKELAENGTLDDDVKERGGKEGVVKEEKLTMKAEEGVVTEPR